MLALSTQGAAVAAVLADPWHGRGYPVRSLPRIPDGFEAGYSWMCPVFENEALDLGIGIDYPDPADREMEELSRFTLYRLSAAREGVECDLFHGDNWNALLAALDRHKARA